MTKKAEAPHGGAERLQKLLARAGYGSRRACEDLIEAGRVSVDGKRATELGAKADPETQEIKVDGKPLRVEQPVYYVLNKPKGIVSTVHDPEGRPTVRDLMKGEKRRIFPVGRLDADSRGLVILTNDGRFTNLLTHPRYGIEKTYVVRVRGEVPDAAVAKLRHGVWLAEGKTLPARVWVIRRKRDETELGVAISEGKNRQVRRMLAAVGFKVLALTRTKIGPLTIRGMPEGAARELSRHEVAELEKAATRNAGAPPPTWAKRQRGSRVRSHGKPDPRTNAELAARLRGLPIPKPAIPKPASEPEPEEAETAGAEADEPVDDEGVW
jgi:pseudouridine synthase